MGETPQQPSLIPKPLDPLTGGIEIGTKDLDRHIHRDAPSSGHHATVHFAEAAATETTMDLEFSHTRVLPRRTHATQSARPYHGVDGA